jgi:hypothetical protein
MTTLSAVIATGTYAAIPAFGIDGRLYLASDTFRLYRDNGTAWVDITPASFSLAPIALPAANGAATYALPSAPQFPAASMYFYNGQKMKYGLFYSIAGNTLTLLTSALPQSGETHELYAS